jgi:hypothetical protein
MITVQELIEKLKQYPQDALVILQSDSEGNGNSPLAEIERAYYTPITTWYGDLCLEDENKNQNCIVLWSVN